MAPYTFFYSELYITPTPIHRVKKYYFLLDIKNYNDFYDKLLIHISNM